MKKRDLTGLVSGHLTVLESAGVKHGSVLWRCKCACGGETIISSHRLTRKDHNGNTKSCGCSRRKTIPMEGKRFGMLVVLEGEIRYVGKKNPHKSMMWHCQCDCGNIVKNVYGTNLRRGNTVSCGCVRRKSTYHVTLHTLLYRYKMAAKKFGRVFELSDAEVEGLVVQDCHYCGSPPASYFKSVFRQRPAAEKDFYYNGIDRVDNALGYTASNCVPCCRLCNFAKGSNGQQVFIEWLQRAARYTTDKN